MACVPFRGDAPPLSEIEIRELQALIPDWEVLETGGVQQLVRHFSFGNFTQALEFTNKVGEIAEGEDHHPTIVTEWGKVSVTGGTHSIKGLHRNDFIMAARTSTRYE